MARYKSRKKKDSNPAKNDGENVENSTPWRESKARKILYDDIMNGLVPLHAKDSNGKSTMKLREIYDMHEEYSDYSYKNFSRRVSSARKTLKIAQQRKQDDADAFQNFVDNNDAVYYSKKGYIQWKGSDAQKLCLKYVKDKAHERMSYRKIYGEHSRFYSNFPFAAFKDHYRSEVRGQKYIAHRKKFGETHKTGKPQPEEDDNEDNEETAD